MDRMLGQFEVAADRQLAVRAFAAKMLGCVLVRAHAQLAVAGIVLAIIGAVVRVEAVVFQCLRQFGAVVALIDSVVVLLDVNCHSLVFIAGAHGGAGLQRAQAMPLGNNVFAFGAVVPVKAHLGGAGRREDRCIVEQHQGQLWMFARHPGIAMLEVPGDAFLGEPSGEEGGIGFVELSNPGLLRMLTAALVLHIETLGQHAVVFPMLAQHDSGEFAYRQVLEDAAVDAPGEDGERILQRQQVAAEATIAAG